MNNYLELKEYIDNSVTKTFNNRLKVRLSEELSKKYDNGDYDEYLTHVSKCIEIIDSLDIIYPALAKPTFYIYIVPLEKSNLLNIPKNFDNNKGSAKPVSSFDIDGYNSAYGVTENIALRKEFNIYHESSTIHELIHLVASMFFNKDRYINEGIAEAVPLYILGYENKWIEHKNMISNIEKEDILTVKELIEQNKSNTYGDKGIDGTSICSYRYSYISSYLICAYILDKIRSVQTLFELLRSSKSWNEYLAYEIANTLDLDVKEFIEGKRYQLEYLNKLKR